MRHVLSQFERLRRFSFDQNRRHEPMFDINLISGISGFACARWTLQSEKGRHQEKRSRGLCAEVNQQIPQESKWQSRTSAKS
jgi:hypothetical protein